MEWQCLAFAAAVTAFFRRRIPFLFPLVEIHIGHHHKAVHPPRLRPRGVPDVSPAAEGLPDEGAEREHDDSRVNRGCPDVDRLQIRINGVRIVPEFLQVPKDDPVPCDRHSEDNDPQPGNDGMLKMIASV